MGLTPPLRSRFSLAVALALLATCAGPVSAALADRPLSPRYQTHTRGNLASAANTLLTCPTGIATCDSVRAGTGGDRRNNDWNMAYVDVDSDAATFNSSTASLSLPAGATVTFAGLYWGADTSAGTGGAAAPAPAFVGTALLDTPAAGGYTSVGGSETDWSSTWPSRYQSFADVTAEVAAAGAGDYTVANVQAGTGGDRYGGWTLVVAYRAPGEPVRSLSVHDGLITVGSGATPSYVLDGFETPAGGPAQATLGLATYEGEYGISGDTARLNGVPLTDAVHPVSNFFDSSISAGGSHVTGKTPNYVDQMGFDSSAITVDGLIPPGGTSATVQVGSTGDTYYLGAVTLVADQVAEAPASSAAPGISGTAEDEQTLTADPGSWSGTDPIDIDYQWQRCDAAGNNCVDIAGATGATYELGDEDVGSTVRVVVTATNGDGSASAASPVSGVVEAAAPTNTAAPTVSGTPEDGRILTADPGEWSGTGPFDVDYQWQRCDADGNNCVDIQGETDPTYELDADDVGGTIRVIVITTNGEGSETATSAPSAPVEAAPPPVGGPPAGDDTPPPTGGGTPPGGGGTPPAGGGAPAGGGTSPADGATPAADDSTPPAGTSAAAGAFGAAGSMLAPSGCQQVSGARTLTFNVLGYGHLRVRIAPNGYVTAGRPLRATPLVSAAAAWRLAPHLRRIGYKLGGRRIAVKRRAPYAVRIGPARLSRAKRTTLTVRVVPKRGKPRVARVQLSTRPCSAVFSVGHRPSPARSLLGLRVDSASPLHSVVFRAPASLVARPASRGTAGKLRVRVAGRRATSFRLSFRARRKGRAATLLAGAGRPRVSVSRGRITVSGLPTGTAIVQLRLRAPGMLATPRAKLRAVLRTDAGTRRLTSKLGLRPAARR